MNKQTFTRFQIRYLMESDNFLQIMSIKIFLLAKNSMHFVQNIPKEYIEVSDLFFYEFFFK